MKRITITFLLLLCTIGYVNASGLSALLTYCSFSTPDNKPYVETYLSVLGNTASFKKNASGKFQASIEIGITFSQGTVISAYKKYTLLSPELTDTLTKPNFIDQQRFNLDNGEYMMELFVLDKNKQGAKAFSKKEAIKINFPPETVTISGIELLESYKKSVLPGPLTKNGYDIVPYVANFYPQNMEKLIFYAEIYHTVKGLGENEQFILLYYLENYETARKLNDFGGHLRASTTAVNVAFSEIPIASLPSGNYNLVLEVHDKSNKIVAFQKTYFQRSNSAKANEEALSNSADNNLANSFVARFKKTDSLAEYIRSTRPIASESENSLAESDIKTKDLTTLQRRLFIFWSSHSPSDPEAGFNKYNEQVIAVQHSFGTRIFPGYNTDRGRVYLKYGAPSVRDVMDKEPSAYPYEIWTYYRLGDNQNNRKFVFYDSDLSTNNYRLIHSDAIGEIFDSNWSMKLKKRNTQINNFDVEQTPDPYGSNAVDDYNHPK
jgi:GWxTD domain-containing protein